MRTTFIQTLLILSLTCLQIIGCSGSITPVTPGDTFQPVLNQASSSPICGQEVLIGLYDISIDPSTGKADIVPERGLAFELNLLKFLQPPAKDPSLISLNFIQPGTNFQTGHIIVDIGIQHPLPSTQYMVFDVMGIFMPAEGDNIGTVDPTLTWPSGSQAKLLNADGYTRWWNQVEFTTANTIFGYTEWHIAPHFFSATSILNPFKYFADGLAPEDPANLMHVLSTARGSFSPSNPGFVERRFEIQFPQTKAVDYRFKFGISGSFAFPDPGWTLPISPDDFCLTSNRPEPVAFSIRDNGSDAFYHGPGDYGGNLRFQLSFIDWQSMGTITGVMDEFTAIYAESPTLFDGTIDLMQGSEWQPGGDGLPTFTMWCIIPNVSPITTTNQEMLVTVVSSFPTDYSVQIPGFNGPDYPTDAALAAYQVWDAPIKSD
jgi:hypothetical protein